jgi:O-antigen/teichoic acid export membrane protein
MKPDREPRKLLGINLTWTVAGRGLYAAVQWLIVIVIANLGGRSEVGLLAFALAIVNPIMVLSQLSLRVLKATDVQDHHTPADYFTLRILTTIAAALVCIVVALVSGLDTTTLQVIFWVVVAKAVDNLSDMAYGFQLNLERHDVMSVSLMSRGILALGGVAVAYGVTHDLAIALACQAIAWVVVFAAYDLPRTKALLAGAAEGDRPRLLEWNPPGWIGLIRLGLPLGVAAFLASTITNAPRYFIERGLGPDSLGLFAALAYFVTFLSLAANATAQTIAPRLGQALHATDPALSARMLGRLRMLALGITGAGVLVAVVAGRPLIEMIYGEAFAEAAPLLPWVMVAGGLSFATTFASYGLIAARRVHSMLWSLVAAASVCVVCSWFLIGRMGLLGAVVGWIAGLGTQLACSELSLARYRSELGPAADQATSSPDQD